MKEIVEYNAVDLISLWELAEPEENEEMNLA